MGATRYYRKPVPVEAWQVTADNADDVAAWVEAQGGSIVRYDQRVMQQGGVAATHTFQVKVFAGYAWVTFGDYVIHDPRGFIVLAADIFAAAYTTEGVPDAAAQQ